MIEQYFQCPYCWEETMVMLDPSIARQTYVEDCQICCNPVEVTVTFNDGVLVQFDATELGQ